ncbi:MAG: hypothetical protein EXS19_03225 [Pedosphaera sp.]|nr:hypothetical protein [Pedosphaera sp.]
MTTQRLLLGGAAAFWLVMTGLLWRAEYLDGKSGSLVPVEVVLEKLLKSPDDSQLDIMHHGKRVGGLRWSPNIIEETAVGLSKPKPATPEGMMRRTAGYSLDVTDGSVTLPDTKRRLRFTLNLNFDRNRNWQDFLLTLGQNPRHIRIESHAASKSLRFTTSDGQSPGPKAEFTFEQLRDPRQLFAGVVSAFGGPESLGHIAAQMVDTSTLKSLTSHMLELRWEARSDWMKMGSARMRVYRLQAPLLDKHKIVITLSRTGEILKAEFPNDITLLNRNLYL